LTDQALQLRDARLVRRAVLARAEELRRTLDKLTFPVRQQIIGDAVLTTDLRRGFLALQRLPLIICRSSGK